jgi:hypothetical protein
MTDLPSIVKFCMREFGCGHGEIGEKLHVEQIEQIDFRAVRPALFAPTFEVVPAKVSAFQARVRESALCPNLARLFFQHSTQEFA